MGSYQTTAVIEKLNSLTSSIVQVILGPKQFIPYEAGQYLKILRKGDEVSYSIANAPIENGKYELHIRQNPSNPASSTFMIELEKSNMISLELPFGDCSLSQLDRDKPILLIAGGTGFAPIKAMIEQLMLLGHTGNIVLIRGIRSQDDLYMDSLTLFWHKTMHNFHCYTYVSESKHTLAKKIIENHLHHTFNWQTVLAGPFDMVYSIRDALVNEGVSVQNLFSDAFSFEIKSV
ncbi:MAG: NAD(P)H-flavin reductase [Legionella sp.]